MFLVGKESGGGPNVARVAEEKKVGAKLKRQISNYRFDNY
jgi:hypothetical protein